MIYSRKQIVPFFPRAMGFFMKIVKNLSILKKVFTFIYFYARIFDWRELRFQKNNKIFYGG